MRATGRADAARGAAGVRLLEAASLPAGLAALRAAGVTALLVEGGGTLVGSLLAADLVDRLYRITGPVWLGAGAAMVGAALFWINLNTFGVVLEPATIAVMSRSAVVLGASALLFVLLSVIRAQLLPRGRGGGGPPGWGG